MAFYGEKTELWQLVHFFFIVGGIKEIPRWRSVVKNSKHGEDMVKRLFTNKVVREITH